MAETETTSLVALVVDDDPTVRFLACESLEAAGYHVVCCEDGNAAIEAFEQRTPDIVLLDIVMPEKDGFAVCRHIRSHGKGASVPILVMTGLDDLHSIARAYELGATDFAAKPINWDVLPYRVSFVLRAGRALESERRRGSRMLHAQRIAALGHWEWDIAGDRLSLSAETCRIFQIDKSSCTSGMDTAFFARRIHPDDASEFQAAVRRARVEKTPFCLDQRIPLPGGEQRIVRQQAEVVCDGAGRVRSILGVVQDITEHKRTEEKLSREHAFVTSIVDGVADPIMVIAPDYSVLFANEAAREAVSPKFCDPQGQKCYQLSHQVEAPCNSDDHPCPLKIVMETRQPTRVLHEHPVAGGGRQVFEIIATPVWDSAGQLKGVIESSRNVTDHQEALASVRSQEAKLYQLAYHDTLTGLPNRRLFLDRMDQTIRKYRRDGKMFGLLFVDLDRFKQINDSLGHSAGDRVIETVGRRLAEVIRDEDSVARFGGDEFVVLLQSVQAVEDAGLVGQKILASVQRPISVNDHSLVVTASMGVCVFPHDGEDVDTLLRNADSAMYLSKDHGRDTFRYYTQDLTNAAYERVTIEAGLRSALERGEFELHYQPLVTLNGGQEFGAEALIRWRSPDMGMTLPNRFIPIAEDSGLIVPIGDWVLRTACRQMVEWKRGGLNIDRIAVNLSCRQVRETGFVEELEDILAQTGCSAGSLELEITENVFIKEFEQTRDTFRRLRDLGVTLSVDDFGTGYSSLSYLNSLPVSKVKVDRSFVRYIPDNANDMSIVAAIVAMGKSLNLRVLAEGVETPEQYRYLRTLGCDQAQGYFIAKPLPPAEFERWATGR